MVEREEARLAVEGGGLLSPGALLDSDGPPWLLGGLDRLRLWFVTPERSVREQCVAVVRMVMEAATDPEPWVDMFVKCGRGEMVRVLVCWLVKLSRWCCPGRIPNRTEALI